MKLKLFNLCSKICKKCFKTDRRQVAFVIIFAGIITFIPEIFLAREDHTPATKEDYSALEEQVSSFQQTKQVNADANLLSEEVRITAENDQCSVTAIYDKDGNYTLEKDDKASTGLGYWASMIVIGLIMFVVFGALGILLVVLLCEVFEIKTVEELERKKEKDKDEEE